MSKILKHKDNIFNFITSKSCFCNVIDEKILKDILNNILEGHLLLYPVLLLSVFSVQIKKSKEKQYHTLHFATVIVLMIMNVYINENKKLCNEKYGKDNIAKILNQINIHIFESVTLNVKTMETAIGIETASKIHKKISSILYEKLLLLTENNVTKDNLKMIKSDIIKNNFDDKTIIEKKYKKMSRIDEDELLNYINNKYGTIGYCSFVFGWLLGIGSEKHIETMGKIGTSFGIFVKLTHDFYNLENDIKNAEKNSHNYVINYGIHKCFSIYIDNKTKFIELCMINDLYHGAIKELVEKIDKTIDKCLKNTELELQSQYSNSTKEERQNK